MLMTPLEPNCPDYRDVFNSGAALSVHIREVVLCMYEYYVIYKH